MSIKLLFFTLFFSVSFLFTAQVPFGEDLATKREPCFKKSLERLGNRYVDWECGGTRGVIDCLEELESDPGSKVVYLRSSGRVFTGTCEMCHENGIKELVTHFENGRTNGIDTTYYASGCIQVIRNHIFGVEEGRWVYFNDTSGLTAWEINHKNGEKEGVSIFYRQRKTGTQTFNYLLNNSQEEFKYSTYTNDTLRLEHYKNGILDGVKKEYYWPNSILKKIVTYKEGVFDGSFIEYDLEGNKLLDAFYVEGKKEGNWSYFYNNGNLLRTESWVKDVREGEFKTFYIQGHLQALETYKKGLKNGSFMEYFPDNKVKRQAIYKNDELVEEHVFDEYGKEIKTFGGKSSKGNEDDALPSSKKKEKKKKSKKEKKEKEKNK